MFTWRIVVSAFALNQLAQIKDRRIQQGLKHAIESLSDEPEKRGKPLTGNLAGYFSLRACSQKYRLIYQIDAQLRTVTVVALGRRKEGDRVDIYRLAERLVKAGFLLLLLFLCLISDHID